MPGAPVACGTSFGALHALLLALRRPNRVAGFVALSGAYDTSRWLDGHFDDDVYFTGPLMFLPGLTDDAILRPIRGMEKKVIATGDGDANAGESVRAAELLTEKGVAVRLDVWPGWCHDWPYWKEMMRTYV
jgi:esterase/lipase superfamily enzyme